MENEEELTEIEDNARKYVAEQKKLSWKKFHEPILEELNEATNIIRQIGETSAYKEQLEEIEKKLKYTIEIERASSRKRV